ncbi:hypothetical protein NFC73_11530 [Pseudarthrobacter sp. RMG13]|uniref:Uncharacterized protein n=1 Tax=Pseudarthrobacter humi TaxID=2952523 RepID=A0ABT1LPG5_9MICC|nr:hypothetical protein [Pseudarthrobacter humi]MCP9000353.1 hypothetical protein [Pseudarthrobacter humi]
MTVGQWLLAFFWNNSELLEGLNKWGGVFMAIIGAALTVPNAVRLHLQPIKTAGQRAWQVMQQALGLTKPVTVSPKSIESNFGGVGTPSVIVHPSWPAEGTNDEQQAWIRGEMRRVEERFEDHVKNNEKVMRIVKLDLKSLEERVFQTIAGLQGQLDEKETAAIKIDSIGLLPILSGIILTGVPEELSHWGVWGWAIFGLGCYLTGNAIYRSNKSGAWSGKLS